MGLRRVTLFTAPIVLVPPLLERFEVVGTGPGLVAQYLAVLVELAALWLGLVIWTFRDIRSRSRDIFAQILATLVVAILNLPGLLIYMMVRPRETLAGLQLGSGYETDPEALDRFPGHARECV